MAMRNNPPGLFPKAADVAQGEALRQRYEVLKDGEPVNKNVFVLSPETDPHALAAIREYAESCRKDNPELAIDLLRWEANIREQAQDDAMLEARDEP